MEPEKKTPEEEKKPAPAAEQKDEPKPEEKPAENKQTDDNGTAEKPDESKAEDKKDDLPFPFSPTIPITSPAPADNDMLLQISFFLHRTERLFTVSMESGCMDKSSGMFIFSG